MRDLNGRVAVVTGGGSGIGRGIARTFGAEGMTVAVLDVQASRAEAVASEIEAAGGRAFAIAVDVTSVASLEAAVKQIVMRAGGVNLLCANAGVLARVAPLAAHTIGDWEYTLSVNVLGTVKTVCAFLPALRERAPDAHILTTASLGGLVSDVRAPIGAYIASKYACVGYSEMLRAELASEGIGVSVLCPGVVASNLMGTSADNRPPAFGAQAAPSLAAAGGGGASASAPPPPVKVMPAEDVGPIVIRAIRANRFHVITHPQTRALVEGRFQAMLADFDFAADA
ncbi:MAG TPA: SDR family NAD(P)-dependent oxidoreductase [Myxococcota bacterium]|nr:SDR family NAD(P)-dependent oxidoreductase [Myxococcota bacterium]